MYIRRTHTSNSATGERYTTRRRVPSARLGGRVRQVTLLNLGRQFRAAAGGVAGTLRAAGRNCVRSGQGALLAGAGPVEREAQRLFARLLARQGVAPQTGGPAGGDVQAVDVDALELSRPRSVGVESVALWAMAEVNFVALLQDLGLSGPQRALIVGAVVGRMAAPGFGTSDPPLAERAQCVGGIAGGRLRDPPPGTVLPRGGPARAEPAQLAIIQALGSDPAREGYRKCLSESSGFTEFHECSATERFFPL